MSQELGQPFIARLYGLICVGILLATSIFWTLLSARLQQSNADQLVNSYLFQHANTFHDSLLPGQHSFLIKWPLFWLVKVFGLTPASFIVFTLITTLLTVMVLAFILYKIERRPLIFGTLCLALASTLLLVPFQPSPGALLPVNMAMLATRNLEYVLYTCSIVLFVRSPRLRSASFWAAAAILALLIASDKLFLTISVGGALLALIVYSLSSGWNLVTLSVRWLVATLLSALAAIGLVGLVNAQRITHIVSQLGNGPYGLLHSAHDIALGFIYALFGLLTNFGANPAYDTGVLRSMPHSALTHLLSTAGPAFLINALILGAGIFICSKLIIASLAHNKDKAAKLNTASLLAIFMIWTMLAAILFFALSNHYWAGDARYLTISFFAIFIAIAAYSRTRLWRPEVVGLAGAVILVGILGSLPAVLSAYHKDQAALAPTNSRNSLIVQVLAQHPVDVLVGDYWRVLPAKLQSKGKLNVMPLAGCSQPRSVLTSGAWNPDLNQHSFAYLLSLDKNLTDFPNCTLDQAITNYGRPNSSVLIAGSLDHPKEILLFYDRGAHKSSPKITLKTPSTVLPVALEDLPYTSCRKPTVMNIVAHEDDDLLFMNPDLVHDLKAEHCIRSVYITAGDAGQNSFYWLGREQGSEAAYSALIGFKDIWIHRLVKLSDRQFITVASPRGNSQISLIFMHLPDGNQKGQGFSASRYESLERLESGQSKTMNAVDGQSEYNPAQLTDAISLLMQTYQPAEIRTQSNYTNAASGDHSDHMAVGRLVKKSYQQFEQKQFEGRVAIPLTFYIGYPIKTMPENVAGQDLTDKEAAFFAYAKHDGAVCGTVASCSRMTYSAYLTREYKSSE